MEVLGAHSLFFPITAPSTQLSCYHRSPNTGNSPRVGVEFILGSPNDPSATAGCTESLLLQNINQLAASLFH